MKNQQPILSSNKTDRKRIYRLLSIIFLILGVISFFLPTGFGVLLCILSIIVSIIFFIMSFPEQQPKSNMQQSKNDSLEKNTNLRGQGCSIASFICAIIPIALLFYCLIVSGGSGSENGVGAVWWYVVIYCWTIGLPLFIVWLVCGILGVKSTRPKLAITSLIMLPAGIVLFVLLAVLLSSLR